MNARTLLFPAITFLLTAFTISTAQAQRADHHLHIRSEAGTDALLKVLKEVKGQTGVKVQPSIDADDVIALLDSTGTQKATLHSTAYFFAMPEMNFANEQTKLRRENEYVASQAAQYPNRLVAFCGVNPLSEYAMEEIMWCGSDGRFAGLKLHLANSKVDLRNPNHVQRLAKVFEAASRHELAIVIHLWTRNPDYGSKDVNAFADNILPQARNVPVQVAHLGGPGTFSEVTSRVAETFSELAATNKPLYENLYFDLAAVPMNPQRATSEKQRNRINALNNKLAELIKKLGPGQVLWGTDWIAGPASVYQGKLNALSLPDSLRKKIDVNTAPYFQEERTNMSSH